MRLDQGLALAGNVHDSAVYCCSLCVLEIDYVLGSVLEKCFYVLDGDVEEAGSGIGCGPGNVWGDEAVFGVEKWVFRGRGFSGENINAGSGDFFIFEGCTEGDFVDELASGGVDEKGGGFHQGEGFGIDHLLIVTGERAMQGDNVTFPEQGFDGFCPNSWCQFCACFQ